MIGLLVAVYCDRSVRVCVASRRPLLHTCKARNAIQGIRLDFESGVRDAQTTATTDSIRMLMHGYEHVFNLTKLVKTTHLHGPRDIELLVCSGLIAGVGEQFRFSWDQVGDHGFVCEDRSKLYELALKNGVLHLPSHSEVQVFRRNNSWDTIR